MGLFRSRSSDGNAPHGVLEVSSGQALPDPEQPSTSCSAPNALQPLVEHNPQHGSSKSATAATAAATAAVVDQQGRRAVSAPELGKQELGPQKDNLTPAQQRTLQHVMLLSKVMDNAITIPIIKKRFGLDAMLGLIPYAGDIAGATVGSYIISRALKYNMPKRLVVRMLINQAIDSCVGIIPFLGDIFDFGFKANARNMKLLQEHLEHPKSATRADTCFLFSLFILVVVVPILLVAAIIGAIVVGIMAAMGKFQ